jgi:SET domain-containing protein
MLRIEAKVCKSKIHGKGLFTTQFIPKGTIVWEFDLGNDFSFTENQTQLLPKNSRIFSREYGWKEKGITYFCADDARYINHSLNNNLEVIHIDVYVLKANRDIEIGEELTENYLTTYDVSEKRNMLEFLR